MGTFAGIFVEKKDNIPECKRDEFANRIEKLYQAGGMMEIQPIQLYGKKVATIRKATMTESGMDFYYNYFEDDCWENAGFSRGNFSVWSNKIGWRHFHSAVVAAYVLEEIYTEGVSVSLINGKPVTTWAYVAWINYLFDEKYHVKNYDPWKLFETFHYLEREYDEDLSFGDKRYAFIGECEICAVRNGTSKALEKYSHRDKAHAEMLALRGMEVAIGVLKTYKQESKIDEESQLNILIDTLHSYYVTDNNENLHDENLKHVLDALNISDAPAFVVKAISELYHKEFWELWEKIKDVVMRKQTSLYGNESYNVVPISTEKFFNQIPDDMIPYWTQNGDFEFSEELWDWFNLLKSKYDVLLRDDFLVKEPLKYIISLMEEADDNYYQIYTFTEFFEETLENLYDKRYQILWKLYEEMLRDSELKKAGDVIFVPDGPEYENVGLHYWGEEPKRRLMNNWKSTDLSKRNNKARVTFRRYMALVVNKELRRKVFGF